MVKDIQKDKKLKKSKILVCTGYPKEGKKLLELGANAVIEKATTKANTDEFCRKVRRLLKLSTTKK